MKRLVILLIPMLAASGGALAVAVGENPDLYGNVLYDEDEATPTTLTVQTRNPDLYGSILVDEQLKMAADETTTSPQAFGDGYGSILLDVGSDPWGFEEPLYSPIN